MLETSMEAGTRLRAELIDEVAERITYIRDRACDRIGFVWALKMIADGVRRLDETDRSEGFLPVHVRPPLMLRWNEAALALHVLREYRGLKGCEISGGTIALMRKLDGYFDGRE